MGILFRIILWAVLFYFLYQFIRKILFGQNASIDRQEKPKTKVYGKGNSKPPLDLSSRDVEDAVYKDVNEEKRS